MSTVTTFYRLHVCENDSQHILGPESLFDLDCGNRFDWPLRELPQPAKKGKMYGWIFGNCWSPFVSQEIKRRLEPLVGACVQWHGPFEIRKRIYFFLNCVNVLDCALPGSDSNLTFIDAKAVGDSWIFRPKGFVRDLLCSEAFRDNCVDSRDTGVRFGRIQEDGWEDFPF